MMKSLLLAFVLLALASIANAASKPNILLIIADDLGYSDIACFGGEIDTPSIDRLAGEGIRFTEYHVNPMCTVTRTSLFTGHTHSQSNNYKNSLPFPKFFKDAGYHTSISGKWHQPKNPLDWGFTSFYGFLEGAINSWTGKMAGKHRIREGRESPQPVASDWYATDAFTDHAIEEINSAVKQGKPFFTYLSFNAPHTPLHAYKEDVVKYIDRYYAGWETLRQQRYARMLAMGIIDERYKLSPPFGDVRIWDEMAPETQRLEVGRMASYAGMVDRMDQNIGRVLDHLDRRGLAENTIVIFFSDNGGAYSNGNFRTDAEQIPWERNSNPFCSNGWSYLRNTPFPRYKSSAEEGGVSAPLIVKWPKELSNQAGAIRKQRLHVSDLYPTFLELLGEEYPERDGSRKLEPLYGKSMLPLWYDSSLPKYAIHDEIFWAFNTTGKGLLLGDWKISSISDGPWRLYNVEEDPATSRDLSKEMPEKLAQMSQRWFDFAENRTAMPEFWRQPLKNYQEGWGYHRIRMVMPAYISATPHMSEMNVPLDTDLVFNFSQPIGFENSKGKTLRLYSTSEPGRVLWELDPEPGHEAEGKRRIIFNDLPRLKPNTTYCLRSDAGWMTLGGKPVGPLNDGAYWFRFRTGDGSSVLAE